MSNDVQLFKCQLKEDFFTQKKVFPVYFPHEWFSFLQLLTTGYQKDFRLDQLGKKILSVQPNVLFHNVTDEALQGITPWLYLVDPKSLKGLQLFASHWLLEQAKNKKLPVPEPLEKKVKQASLVSLPTPLTTTELKQNKQLVSGLIRFLFSTKKRTIHFDTLESVKTMKDDHFHYITKQVSKSETLEFSPCFSGGVHEVCSEELAFGKEFLSRVLSFDYQLEPLSQDYYVYIKLSNRRWMVKSDLSLSSTHAHSLFVKWRNKQHLLRFSIQNDSNGNPMFITKQEKEIFDQYVNHQYTLQNVLDDPDKFLNNSDIFMGIPYGENSFSGFQYGIGSGVEPQIRKGFLEQIKKDFPYFSFVPMLPIETDKGKQGVPINPKTNVATGEINEKGEEKKKSIFDFSKTTFIGQHKTINLLIWEDKQHVKNELVSILSSYQGIKKDSSKDKFTIRTKNKQFVTIELFSKKKGIIDHHLSNNEEKTHEKHKNDVIKLLKKEMINGFCYSLIEMKDYSKVKTGGDPKKPVRQAFAQMEMKTQFVQPKSEAEFRHRVESSLFDILTKSGFVKGINQLTKSVYSYHLLKFKQVKGAVQYIPVLAKMTGDYLGYYFFDDQKWYSLQDVTTKMNKLSNHLPIASDWKQAERLLSYELKQDPSDKILIFPSYLRNHRTDWEIDFLKNEQISRANPYLFQGDDKLTIVRMNTLSDVPTYLTFNGKGETAKIAGIVSINDKLFYSIGSKPGTDKKSNNKLFTRYTLKTHKFQQRKLLELVVLNRNPSIKEEEVVKIIHNLRNVNISYEVHLSVDFTQYLVHHLNEYIFN